MESIEAYPLSWPIGQPRSDRTERSRFRTSFERARRLLVREVERMGGRDLIISTNVPLRNDGFPFANHKRPDDTGVAIYFNRKGKQLCFACDRWYLPEENILAICKTIEAMRGIERWGSSDLLDRVFTGFAQLAAPEGSASPRPQGWWQVLEYGVLEDVPSDPELLKIRWKELARRYHPDMGDEADGQRMVAVNEAYAKAKAYFTPQKAGR